MSESEGEIEYLDEDADIVQHCVQTVAPPPLKERFEDETDEKSSLLLVERTRGERKRNRKIEEDDSDYDPRDDPPVPIFYKPKKKKSGPRNPPKSTPNKQIQPEKSIPKTQAASIGLSIRKNMDIRIPDYDDPLCLPVRGIRNERSEIQRLANWNNACLAHLRHCDSLLKPEKGKTKGSTRCLVLKNVVNKETGKTETGLWTKTSVENEDGAKKSQIFQSILPKFREKKLLNLKHLKVTKKPKKFHHTTEMILTKELHKDGEALVIYNVKKSLSAVYKLIDNDNSINKAEDDSEKEEPKRCLREVTCCKTCATCYQCSWRGVAEKADDKRHIRCPVCRRTFVSVYNLLTHVRTHADADVRRHRNLIAVGLSSVLDYHYKCRICQEHFLSIKKLRQHVKGHKGTETFTCEIGNHVTT